LRLVNFINPHVLKCLLIIAIPVHQKRDEKTPVDKKFAGTYVTAEQRDRDSHRLEGMSGEAMLVVHTGTIKRTGTAQLDNRDATRALSNVWPESDWAMDRTMDRTRPHSLACFAWRRHPLHRS